MGTGSSQGSPFNFNTDGELVVSADNIATDANGSAEVVLVSPSGDPLAVLTPLSLFSANGRAALSTSASEVLAANDSRIWATVTNLDAAIIVYIGDDNTVTSANGYPLLPGAEFVIEDFVGPIWMIAASGTPSVAYLEA